MFRLSNRTYDILKWAALVALPATSVLLATLAKVWGWGVPIDAIVVSISALETFIGALIGVSAGQYKKGE